MSFSKCTAFYYLALVLTSNTAQAASPLDLSCNKALLNGKAMNVFIQEDLSVQKDKRFHFVAAKAIGDKTQNARTNGLLFLTKEGTTKFYSYAQIDKPDAILRQLPSNLTTVEQNRELMAKIERAVRGNQAATLVFIDVDGTEKKVSGFLFTEGFEKDIVSVETSRAIVSVALARLNEVETIKNFDEIPADLIKAKKPAIEAPKPVAAPVLVKAPESKPVVPLKLEVQYVQPKAPVQPRVEPQTRFHGSSTVYKRPEAKQSLQAPAIRSFTPSSKNKYGSAVSSVVVVKKSVLGNTTANGFNSKKIESQEE